MDLRFAGSNPAEGDGDLRAKQLLSTVSFQGEVKPSVPSCEILRNVKKYLGNIIKDISNAKFINSFAMLLLTCYHMTVCKMVRELWWTIHEFFYVDINPPWFYMHIAYILPGG
jgi:hypothetical protein